MLLREDPAFEILIWAGGMHLGARFGRPIDLVRGEGFEVARELDFLSEPPDPGVDAAHALNAVVGAIRADRPQALLLVGDRSETISAAVAATLEGVPIAHLHGGEETEGAIDNAFRHALTKLAHLHLVSHESHARRVIQMGEDPDRVIVVGAAGLDNARRGDLPDRKSLEENLGFPLRSPVVLVTVHPTTLAADPCADAHAVAAAIAQVPATYVVTLPNADADASVIRDLWLARAADQEGVHVIEALGERRYWGMLRVADAVLGNSSSGIIEAPSAGVPTVNVGDRQKGRLRHPGTRDVPADAPSVASALREALRPEERPRLAQLSSPYLEGPVAPRIVAALASWGPGSAARKRFRDLVGWTGR
jgi:UDP-hydrolysing UDP-N-acetyl-D-glucosamine 2-epimerase